MSLNGCWIASEIFKLQGLTDLKQWLHFLKRHLMRLRFDSSIFSKNLKLE